MQKITNFLASRTFASRIHDVIPACVVYAREIEAGSCDGLLVGPPAKPVFRRKI